MPSVLEVVSTLDRAAGAGESGTGVAARSDGEAMAQATTQAKEMVLFFCTVFSFYQLTHSR